MPYAPLPAALVSVSPDRPFIIETPRLILRPWRERDRDAFAAMNADPRVMHYFVKTLSQEESDAFFELVSSLIVQRGWGFWAVEVKGEPSLAGMVGLHQQTADFTYPSCIEIGWRFVPSQWGKGYAAEAARAALMVGFTCLEMEEIVAFTTVSHIQSQKVMRFIGMKNKGDIFQHPRVPEGHPWRTHVLYRLSRQEWENDQS